MKHYPPSKSGNFFLSKIEKLFNIKIQKEFFLEGRFFDGKYKTLLFEIDGNKWHSSKEQVKIDKLKNDIAKRNNYKLIRIKLNSVNEIGFALLMYRDILKESIVPIRDKK